MRHLLRRISFYLVALWASVTLNFVLPRLVPGNPAEVLIGRLHGRASPQALHALEIAFGVDNKDPIYIQYWQYLGNLLHGNLGISITYYPTPVIDVIRQDMPWTLAMVGIATIISFILGTLLGIVIAWRRGGTLDAFSQPFFTFFSAIPYFWFALILLYVFAFLLGWFPVSGGYDAINTTPSLSPDFIISAIWYGTLPAITIVVSSIAGWMLTMRNTMVTTLTEDYVAMAEAKGLTEWRVMLVYAARNAVLPNITNFALTLGFIVSGSLLTEIVFSYPGIGFGLLQAVDNHDYPLMQGLFMIIAVAVLAANFLADFAYALLDPRVRTEGGN